MPPRDPFWVCHECGAQTRPITIDGVPHCASCNSEFIEILDSEINPDPTHELPLPPGSTPAPAVPPRTYRTEGAGSSPSSPSSARPAPEHGAQGGSWLGGIFSSLLGAGDGDDDRPLPEPPRAPGQAGPNGGRTFEWNFGNGTFRVQGYSGPVGGLGQRGQAGPANPFGNPFFPSPNPWVGGYAGAPGNPGDGLEAFFPGFGAQPRRGGRGQGGPEALEGVDLLQALMGIIMEEGGQPGLPSRGQLGDYVMTEQGFQDVLERLMQAAGPQGPLPASQDTIDHLPRYKLDEKTLESSQYKDCPVCFDAFELGQEVIKIQCGHIFHPDCLVPWLQTNGSCPVCRASLVADGEEGQPSDARTSAQASSPQANAEQPSDAPAAAATPFAGAQGVITSVLNRLFGQSGAEGSPTVEQPDPISNPHFRDSSPSNSNPMPSHSLGRSSSAEPDQSSSRFQAGEGPTADPPEAPLIDLLEPSEDADTTLFRAHEHAGHIAAIPWSAENRQHVSQEYALLGGDEGEPMLFLHAVGGRAPGASGAGDSAGLTAETRDDQGGRSEIGDFSLLQMRRIAGQRGPAVVERGVCCHYVGEAPPGPQMFQAAGRAMRSCAGAHRGAEGSTSASEWVAPEVEPLD